MIWLQLILSALFICCFSPRTEAFHGLGLDYSVDAFHYDDALVRAVRSAGGEDKGFKIPDTVKDGFRLLLSKLATAAVSSEAPRGGSSRTTIVKLNQKQEDRFFNALYFLGRLLSRTSLRSYSLRAVSQIPKVKSFGVAKINYYREGQICSGVHLKPWIVLTVADCVYSRDINKLFATVTTPDSPIVGITVQVHSIKFDPKYRKGSPHNNIALMAIYSQIDWKVEAFQLPNYDLTTEDILTRKMNTYANDWAIFGEEDNRYLVEGRLSVTKDYGVCGLLSPVKDWYCVDRKGVKREYLEVDRGLPFYYYKNGVDKELLAVYTGTKLKEKNAGHLYEEVYPSIYWVREFVSEHPVPPS